MKYETVEEADAAIEVLNGTVLDRGHTMNLTKVDGSERFTEPDSRQALLEIRPLNLRMRVRLEDG